MKSTFWEVRVSFDTNNIEVRQHRYFMVSASTLTKAVGLAGDRCRAANSTSDFLSQRSKICVDEVRRSALDEFIE